MEHLLQLAAESNSLSVDRDSYQSSSAPTSPTKVPISSLIPSGSGGDSCDGSTHIEVAYVPQRCGSICYPELQNRVKGRSVKFPEDHSIVTGYHEAPDPYQFGKWNLSFVGQSVKVTFVIQSIWFGKKCLLLGLLPPTIQLLGKSFLFPCTILGRNCKFLMPPTVAFAWLNVIDGNSNSAGSVSPPFHFRPSSYSSIMIH